MMYLIGKTINHNVFGSGIVTDLSEDILTVCFHGDDKRFVYPDAFRQFLTFQDEEAQQYMQKLLREKELVLKKKRREERAKRERKRKLMNYKIAANAHAVFNITEDQAADPAEPYKVSTGTYLSGRSKGQPRIAKKMRPNSACLLTERPDGQPEEGRIITGIFMVKEDFFGEDVQDGIIEAHPRYRIRIPKEEKMLFWKYLGPDTPPRWGNTAFKYCSGDVICQILADIAQMKGTAAQNEAAEEFYNYFCERNNLDTRMITA